jgi:transcriptional regulator of arginine metabolism
MKCTQATLSRDLRQLGISRGFDGRGGYRYVLPYAREEAMETMPGSNAASITGMIWARGLLLISTPPGFAPAVAIRIDRAGRYEIAGTVAGDDTILLIPRDNISNEAVEECLSTIFES